MEDKMTYKEAVERLEALVCEIENPDHPLDAIQKEVEEAMKLVEYCKKCLTDSESSLLELIDKK